MKYSGTWHIYEMEMWDEEYFNMEVQAYIKIDSKGLGDFQFGLVAGRIDGEIDKESHDEKFRFTWEGGDEGEDKSGSGWLRLKDASNLEGQFKFHLGDKSTFLAKRAK